MSFVKHNNIPLINSLTCYLTLGQVIPRNVQFNIRKKAKLKKKKKIKQETGRNVRQEGREKASRQGANRLLQQSE